MDRVLDFIRERIVKNTHEWIAFKVIESLDNEPWRNIFLKHIETLLKGSKDPDKKFKDWKNHVFHPPSWGGAPEAAVEWYDRFREYVTNSKWKEAVYAFGVLSHYIADPLHPLHTGQTEDEKKVHKFHEFGTSLSLKRYEDIKPQYIEISDLKQEVIKGANLAHKYYFDVVKLYDASKGFEYHWDLGISDELHNINKKMLEHAISIIYSLLIKTINDVSNKEKIKIPKYRMTFKMLILQLKYPIFWARKWLEKRSMKKTTKRMKKELKKRGKIYSSLPPDDKGLVDYFMKLEKEGKLNMDSAKQNFLERRKKVVKIAEKEVEKPIMKKERKPEKERVTETQAKREIKKEVHVIEKQTKLEKEPEKHIDRKVRGSRYRLHPDDDIEKAPEIGKKTADKLKVIGIIKVEDLLKAKYEDVKKALPWLKKEDLERWKIESKLMMKIPEMRVKDVVYMYHAGIRNVNDLKRLNVEEILSRIKRFLETKEGERVKRWLGEVSLEDIERWKELVEG